MNTNSSRSEKKSWPTLEISGFFVAIMALFVSVCQLQQNKEQNKRSIQPGLLAYWHGARDEKLQGLWLENRGVGPAYILDFEVFLDGELIRHKSIDAWEIVRVKCMSEHRELTLSWLHTGAPIATDSKHLLFGLNHKSRNTNEVIAALSGMKDRLKIKIYYQSSFKDERFVHTWSYGKPLWEP